MERKQLCLGIPSYLNNTTNTWELFCNTNDLCSISLLGSSKLYIMSVQGRQYGEICFSDFLHFYQQQNKKFLFQTASGFYGLQVLNEQDVYAVQSCFENITTHLKRNETSISKTLDSPGAMNPSIEKHVSNPNIQIKDNSSKKIFFHEKNIFENTAAQKHYELICDRMRTAIELGNKEEAKSLIAKLAEKSLKLSLHVLDKKIPDNNIWIHIKIEGRDGKPTTIVLAVDPFEITIKMLKLKLAKEYQLPISCQRWIIQKRIALDHELLCNYGVTQPETEIYLYLLPIDDVNNGNEKSTQTDDSHFEKHSAGNNLSLETSKDFLGWDCPACTLRNIPTIPGCVACSTERPKDYIVPLKFILPPEEVFRLFKEQEAEELTHQSEEQRRMAEKLEAEINYQSMYDLMQMKLLRNEELFECPICYANVEKGHGVVLRECLHTFCKNCLMETINTSDNPEVDCPYNDKYACPAVITHQEIEEILNQEDYEKFLQRSLRVAENSNPNTFHCRTPNCTGWCFYEDDVNFFDCPLCRSKNCLTCRAIHTEKTCKDYQEELKIKALNDENAQKTQQMFDEMIKRGDAMLCPSCSVMVQKKSGCDWLKCTMCKTEICWATKGPRWGPKGFGDTSGGCKCRLNLVPCTPTCGNCH